MLAAAAILAAAVMFIWVFRLDEESKTSAVAGFNDRSTENSSATKSSRIRNNSPQTHKQQELRKILTIRDPQECLNAFVPMLERLDKNNVREIVDTLETYRPPDPENAGLYTALLSKWASFAGDDAMDYAMTSLDGDVRLDAGTAAAMEWAATDLSAAARFVSDMPDAYGKDYIVYAFVAPFVDEDPQTAMNWVDQLPSAVRETAANHGIRRWLERDSAAASEWVVDQTATGVPTVMLQQTAIHLAQKDLDLADRFITNLPNSNSQIVAMSSVVDWLALDDSSGVADWLNEFDNSLAIDPVFESFVTQILPVDPNSALTWAEAITDERTRQRLTTEIHRQTGTGSEIQH